MNTETKTKKILLTIIFVLAIVLSKLELSIEGDFSFLNSAPDFVFQWCLSLAAFGQIWKNWKFWIAAPLITVSFSLGLIVSSVF